MAEPVGEHAENVLKNEKANETTTEDKEAENASQNHELSKSENDRADSESALKNTDVESSVGGVDQEKDGTNGELVNEVSFIFIEIN